MKTRRGISKRTRFEVMKRDGFVCKYCGNSPTVSPLVVDHVIPVAKGGTDDPANLVASCVDCNSGKSDVPLAHRKLRAAEVTEAQREQAEQIAEYLRVQKGVYDAKQRIVDELAARWADKHGRPDSAFLTSLRRSADDVGVARTLEAIDVTARKELRSSRDAMRYFHGVVRQMKKSAGATRSASEISELRRLEISNERKEELVAAYRADTEAWCGDFVFLMQGQSGPICARVSSSLELLKWRLRPGMVGEPRVVGCLVGAERVLVWVREHLAAFQIEGAQDWFRPTDAVLNFGTTTLDGLDSWLEDVDAEPPWTWPQSAAAVLNELLNFTEPTMAFARHRGDDVDRDEVWHDAIVGFLSGCGVFADHEPLACELATRFSLRGGKAKFGPFELEAVAGPADPFVPQFVIRKHTADGIEEAK